MKTVSLQPVRESLDDYAAIEKELKLVFRRVLYLPLLRELQIPRGRLENARSPLLAAITSGRLRYEGGFFKGGMTAAVSKELKALGATWDRSEKAWRLLKSDLPGDLYAAVQASESRFLQRLARVDRLLSDQLPAELAGQVDVSSLFDSTLWKVDRQFHKTLERIAVPPELTPHRRRRIADEWQNNMELWVKDFTEAEIVRLRKSIQRAVLKGDRYESVVQSIQRSYGVTSRKAHFLARQETGLLMAKFKETRYQESGIQTYKWRCVAGSKLHPVRPAHKALDGKLFRFDDPPITTALGEPVRRNNPGEDYNCRCTAIPQVTFREKTG